MQMAKNKENEKKNKFVTKKDESFEESMPENIETPDFEMAKTSMKEEEGMEVS